MRRLLKQITPPILWDIIERTRDQLLVAVGERRACLKTEFRKNNAGLGVDSLQFRPGLSIRIHPDSRVGFEFFCYRSLEMVDEMNCFIEATQGKERLLDIGAFHGIFSLVFAMEDPQREVLALDASPIAFTRLTYNIGKNNLPNIKPVESAVSDEIGNLSMHYEWEHAIAARIDNQANTINVPMTTGDALCRSENFQPDVIKIDVEGHEVKVLKGLAKTIEEHAPLIFLEVHPKRIAAEGDSTSSLEDFFRELPYSAQLISGDPFPLSSFQALDKEERLVLRKDPERAPG